MAGFNVPTRMTPERLAQIAAAGFRPPQPMNMPATPPTPGFNVGEGISALAAGFGALGGMKGDDLLNRQWR
jgi:hypothetical protein